MASQPAAAVRQLTQYQKKVSTLAEFLDARRGALATVAAKTLTVERVVKIVVGAASRTPDLLECSLDSIYGSVHRSVQLGLEPGGPLGHAYLVPFKNRGKAEAQLVIGYRGMIELARRSGQIVSIEAHVVRQGDEFVYEKGLDPKLIHKPNLETAEPGALRAVYAIARLKDGGMQHEVMTKAEIDRIRGRSQAGRSNFSPWHTDYDEMARKTVLKRLWKWLPVRVEDALTAAALAQEDEAIEVTGTVVEDVPEEPPALPESQTEALKEELRAAAPPPDPAA